MTRSELEHAIRAACDVANEQTVIVFGSQAILGKYPDPPAVLQQSFEADIAPLSNDPDVADRIDGALGEGSTFHRLHGFYVHGLTLDAALLPAGWERRTIPIRNASTNGMEGRCVEAHDLAASKLAAFREKDRDFVHVLLATGMVKRSKLLQRIDELPVPPEHRQRMTRWVELTLRADPPDLGG